MTGNIHSNRLIGRREELANLYRLAERPGGQLVLISGRRRIGKSFLLEHFIHDRRAIFYQATQQTETAELAAFSDLVRGTLGVDDLPAGVAYPSWESALTSLVKHARDERLIVVLDEFPYLCESTRGLPSIIQRWWDRVGKRSGIMLIVCGSAQTLMERLDDTGAPLYHRFTGKLNVRMLSYRDAAQFTPQLSAADKARIYAILGGTPFNLDQWDPDHGVRENLLDLFADPMSSLVDSAEHVLTTELPDPRVAYRVLQAIALGKSRFAEIHDFAEVHERALPRLVGFGLIDRRIPATEDREKSKRSLYTISDPYLRFYFRFIARNRGLIERGLGVRVVDEQILPHLDDHMGFSFEEIARTFMLELVRKGEVPGDDVGSWWSRDGQQEIDIVGTSNLRPTFIGTVKWRAQALDMRVLRDLERDAAVLGIDESAPRIVIGRGGCDERVLTSAGVRGYSAEDLYR
ncbi:MAG TPA: ATP-binding protein [Candidatus Baltobacteraceae bacterium]|jgi:hypothetical protein|nr:ATP-binding protein [Candidatus Baltobacteraceae bacterium]